MDKTASLVASTDYLSLSGGYNATGTAPNPLQATLDTQIVFTVTTPAGAGFAFKPQLVTQGGQTVQPQVYDAQSGQPVTGSGAISVANSTTKSWVCYVPSGLFVDAILQATALTTGPVTAEITTGKITSNGVILNNQTYTSAQTFSAGQTFNGTSGSNTITVPTAEAVAYSISDGTNTYLSVNSSTPGLTVGQALTLASLLYESVTGGITAHAGGGQSSAVALTTEVNQVSTVATAGDSVKLPASSSTAKGATIVVINSGANAMQVYGSGSDTINGVAATTGVSQMPNSVNLYVNYGSGTWVCEGIGTGFSGSLQTVSTASGITAHAGGGQGSAAALTQMNNRITTVATTGDSVVLPTNAPGMTIGVFNAGANSCNVFPDSGAQINGGGANAAYALAAGHNAVFYCLASNTWHAISGT